MNNVHDQEIVRDLLQGFLVDDSYPLKMRQLINWVGTYYNDGETYYDNGQDASYSATVYHSVLNCDRETDLCNWIFSLKFAIKIAGWVLWA